jgi:hypothetical protein
VIAFSAVEVAHLLVEIGDYLARTERARDAVILAADLDAARLAYAEARHAADCAGMLVMDLGYAEPEERDEGHELGVQADDLARDARRALDLHEAARPRKRDARRAEPGGDSDDMSNATSITNARAAAPHKIAVSTGRRPGPVRVCLYAVHGLGKTTLAGESPDALLLDIAGGSDHVDCARIEQKDLRTFPQFLAALETIATDPAFAQYKTIAVDELTGLESLIHKFIVWRDKPSSKDRDTGYVLSSGIEAYGFKKGFDVALVELDKALLALEALHRQGRNIFLLGHVGIERKKRPDGEDYDAYAPRAHASFSARISQWCDVVAFGQFETVTTKTGKYGRAKVDVNRSRARLLHVQPSAAWDAKTRWPMPPKMNFDAATFWAELRKGQVGQPKMLRKEIEQTLTAVSEGVARLTDDAAATQFRHVATAGAEALANYGDDTARLARLRDRARVQLAELERILEAQGEALDDGEPPADVQTAQRGVA